MRGLRHAGVVDLLQRAGPAHGVPRASGSAPEGRVVRHHTLHGVAHPRGGVEQRVLQRGRKRRLEMHIARQHARRDGEHHRVRTTDERGTARCLHATEHDLSARVLHALHHGTVVQRRRLWRASCGGDHCIGQRLHAAYESKRTANLRRSIEALRCTTEALIEGGQPVRVLREDLQREVRHQRTHVLLMRPEPRGSHVEPRVRRIVRRRGQGEHASTESSTGLEQHHGSPRFGKLPRGGQPREAATHDGHVVVHLRGRDVGRCGVVHDCSRAVASGRTSSVSTSPTPSRMASSCNG